MPQYCDCGNQIVTPNASKCHTCLKKESLDKHGAPDSLKRILLS